ncbi:MAG: hypothetical protein A2V64_10920 [Bacteroidetes bacterium RBG_13_43_22]|nr:MAG: hypothetical protein A2V64_10920 [Bacteroidetes bacterium RBG_13_43_22]
MNKDWELILKGDLSTKVNLSHILDRIHHIIRKNENMKRKKPFQRVMRIYVKAAAILLLPLLVAGGLIYGYISQRFQDVHDQEISSMIYAPLGSRVSFNLPDGTTGMLNSGSYLSYSIPFAENRHVQIEGEAWFEVNKNKDYPFEITAGKSKVKVLGTHFNISAYAEENYVEVVLLKGKLEFSDTGKSEKITIQPSERLIFRNGNVTKSITDPSKYNAWTEGKLVFRGDPMNEVVRRIERWYNVEIILADKELEKYSFRATFQDDSLEDVLKFLAMTSPISYDISPRKMQGDGIYKKVEITIHKKNQ